MRFFAPYRAASLILLALFCLPAFGEGGATYRNKTGVDFRFFKLNPQASIGWLAGLRTARYMGDSQVHIGLAAYYGAPLGGNPTKERVIFGGLTLGYDGKLSRILLYGADLFTGYGDGRITTQDPLVSGNSFFVVEPSAGLGFSLGGGWRLMFTANYTHMTSAPRFSGPSFGIRFDYKTTTSVRELND